MKKQTGILGEKLAALFISKLGYKIIKRNYRIRGGEIDIIAIDNNCLVYVEVKTRTNHKFGLPEEAVTPYKIKFIERAAKFFKSQNPKTPQQERIDVVSVDLTYEKPLIRLIKNAGF